MAVEFQTRHSRRVRAYIVEEAAVEERKSVAEGEEMKMEHRMYVERALVCKHYSGCSVTERQAAAATVGGRTE